MRNAIVLDSDARGRRWGFALMALAVLVATYLDYPFVVGLYHKSTCLRIPPTWSMVTREGRPFLADNQMVETLAQGRLAFFRYGDEVPMIAPDGWMGYVPAANAARALDAGYRFNPYRVRETEAGKRACFHYYDDSAEYPAPTSLQFPKGFRTSPPAFNPPIPPDPDGHRYLLHEIRPEPGLK